MKKEFLAIITLAMLFACKEDEPPVVTAIKLDVNELELKIGESHEFKVSHTPPEAKTPLYDWTISPYTPVWGAGTSYDIATLDANGKVTATKEGTTTVTVQTLDIVDPVSMKPFVQTCTIKIKPIEAESISIDKKEVALKGGEKATLSIKVSPENTTNLNLYWKSSNTKIVTVAKDDIYKDKAIITAVGAGEAIVTAMISNNSKIYAECKISVGPTKLEGLSLSEKEKTVIQGEQFTLSPIFNPANATNKNIAWSSSDESIAKVNNTGLVSTFMFGECTIKAISEDGVFEATCKLSVKPLPVENINFSEDSYKIEIGGEKQLSVIFTPANAGNKKIKWSTSNSIIAPIDNNGLVKGNSTGWATITAESEDGGHIATCQIWVAEIDQFVDLYFPSASVVVLNGYTTGTIYSGIRNNSSKTITLTRFSIIDSGTWQTVAETTDNSMLGALPSGQSTNLGGRINNVYEPIYVWEFTYNGLSYRVQKQYGKDSPFSAKVESKGYSNTMINLSKSK